MIVERGEIYESRQGFNIWYEVSGTTQSYLSYFPILVCLGTRHSQFDKSVYEFIAPDGQVIYIPTSQIVSLKKITLLMFIVKHLKMTWYIYYIRMEKRIQINPVHPRFIDNILPMSP